MCTYWPAPTLMSETGKVYYSAPLTKTLAIKWVLITLWEEIIVQKNAILKYHRLALVYPKK